MLQGILPAFSGLAELPPPVQQFLQSHTFVLREPQLVDDLWHKRRSELAADVVAEQSGGATTAMPGGEGQGWGSKESVVFKTSSYEATRNSTNPGSQK